MSTYESLGSTFDDENASTESNPKKFFNDDFTKSTRQKISQLLCSGEFIRVLALGQLLSILICGTGVFSGLLQQENVNTPTAQSFLMYCVLCLVYTTRLAFTQGDLGLVGVLRSSRGWKYLLIGVIDVEANYFVVKAYGYTSVTSVQVLDCFSIVTVVVLSRLMLKTHYRHTHYGGVCLALVGVVGLILADILTGRNKQEEGPSNPALGDFLVILGATLYGVSNVAQEWLVKEHGRSEFLGMLGLFSTPLAGLQTLFLEEDQLSKVDFTSYKIFLPWLGFVLFLVLIYTCMSYVIQQTSATVTNISILSADFYALVLGIFIFGYSFHFLYLVSFGCVLLGVALYNYKPVDQGYSLNTDQTSDFSQPPNTKM